MNMSMPVLALGLVASRRPVLKWHGRAVKHRGPSGLRGNLASPCHPVFGYLLAACSTPQCVWAAPSGLRAFLEATDGILRVAPDSFEVGPGTSFLPRPCTDSEAPVQRSLAEIDAELSRADRLQATVPRGHFWTRRACRLPCRLRPGRARY